MASRLLGLELLYKIPRDNTPIGSNLVLAQKLHLGVI